MSASKGFAANHPQLPQAELRRAAEILKRGGLVAFPTETVYGLGAAAENPRAVRRIFEVKGRPATHPLIVHLPGRELLKEWAAEIPGLAWRLAEEFWPGPLTLILRRSAKAPDAVTGGLETVGLRVPAHPMALELLRAFGGGIAAPSANRFGHVSPTTAAHVRDDLGAAVDMILDGGPCRVGIESTIVDLSQGAPAILRPGGVTREALERCAGCPVPVRTGGPVHSPGQLPSHYAPEAEVLVVEPRELLKRAARAAARGLRVVVLTTTALPRVLPPGMIVLPAPRSSTKFAQQLYSLLRTIDRRGADIVMVCLPEEKGLGLALADRLRRAAARRER